MKKSKNGFRSEAAYLTIQIRRAILSNTLNHAIVLANAKKITITNKITFFPSAPPSTSPVNYEYN